MGTCVYVTCIDRGKRLFNVHMLYVVNILNCKFMTNSCCERKYV